MFWILKQSLNTHCFCTKTVIMLCVHSLIAHPHVVWIGWEDASKNRSSLDHFLLIKKDSFFDCSCIKFLGSYHLLFISFKRKNKLWWWWRLPFLLLSHSQSLSSGFLCFHIKILNAFFGLGSHVRNELWRSNKLRWWTPPILPHHHCCCCCQSNFHPPSCSSLCCFYKEESPTFSLWRD